MSSSPAIIRSAVDFPQPDGPTRIMNSPSAIVEVHVLDGLEAVGVALGDVRRARSRPLRLPPYPLTAPAVRPATMRRWKIRTMMMIGIVTTTAAAAIAAGRLR